MTNEDSVVQQMKQAFEAEEIELAVGPGVNIDSWAKRFPGLKITQYLDYPEGTVAVCPLKK